MRGEIEIESWLYLALTANDVRRMGLGTIEKADDFYWVVVRNPIWLQIKMQQNWLVESTLRHLDNVAHRVQLVLTNQQSACQSRIEQNSKEWRRKKMCE